MSKCPDVVSCLAGYPSCDACLGGPGITAPQGIADAAMHLARQGWSYDDIRDQMVVWAYREARTAIEWAKREDAVSDASTQVDTIFDELDRIEAAEAARDREAGDDYYQVEDPES